MTFSHLHDAADFLVFRDKIARLVEADGRRHMAELRRTWQLPSFTNRSEAQRRRWANAKGTQQ